MPFQAGYLQLLQFSNLSQMHLSKMFLVALPKVEVLSNSSRECNL
ncbi:hypothetical protein P608_18450 [Comamonas thiooxydans]|uniref:Uncharacterized protein n=1 Tax=Comamonas thiooxydans TaxID=363952 RepID=A0A0E3BTZ1_9BURK|nr:hypothetical protein P608_18450 [Comamonas thiooxydans]KGH14367.1 hypothetical protein P607_22880 [Comamonas thiooxydans]